MTASTTAGAGSGQPAPTACSSNIHPDRDAVVWGTFHRSRINGRPDQHDVGYCRTCADLFTDLRWFTPNA